MDVCMGSFGISTAMREFPPVFPLIRMMNCFPTVQSLEIHYCLQLLSAEACPPSQLAQLDRPQEDIKLVVSSPWPTSGPWESLKSFYFINRGSTGHPQHSHFSFSSSISSQTACLSFSTFQMESDTGSLSPVPLTLGDGLFLSLSSFSGVTLS